MKSSESSENAIDHYSESGFWEKAKRCARAAGEQLFTQGFTLYYCLQDAKTPKWAKTVIIGALGYWIMPMDALPDILPAVGYTDDLGAIAAAGATVAAHIREKHRNQAKQQVKTLLG